MALEDQMTTDEGVKPFPVAVRVNDGSPAWISVGLMEVNTGLGKLICCWQPTSHTTSAAKAKPVSERERTRNSFTPESPSSEIAQKTIVKTTKDVPAEQSGCLKKSLANSPSAKTRRRETFAR